MSAAVDCHFSMTSHNTAVQINKCSSSWRALSKNKIPCLLWNNHGLNKLFCLSSILLNTFYCFLLHISFAILLLSPPFTFHSPLWGLILFSIAFDNYSLGITILLALLQGVNSHIDLDHRGINRIRNRSSRGDGSLKKPWHHLWKLTQQDSVCTIKAHFHLEPLSSLSQ